MKKVKFSDYEIGADIPELRSGPIAHMDLVRYAGASGDFNPIHTDPEFARSVGLGGTIAHGMYVMAQIGRLCTNFAHPSQIRFFGVKFKGMAKPGETLVCTGKVKRKKEENGEKLITVSVEAADTEGNVKAGGDLIIAAE